MRNIVNALLMNEGKVLLARRSPHRRAHRDRWSFPGGHVETGETLEQALIREAGEEIGVMPLAYTAVTQISDLNRGASTTTYHMYAVREWSGQPNILDEEHTELRWFPLEEAMTLPDLAL